MVRRYVRWGLIDADARAAVQEVLGALPVVIVQDPRVRHRAQEIAQEFNLDGVYDSTYAALAALMGSEFWTVDRSFHRAVRDGLRFVRFAGDFEVRTG